MDSFALDAFQLLIRWIHLIVGIAWIGASFYFVWLDNSLLPPERAQDADEGVGGELWAVHGGGFYRVQKFRVAPPTLPSPLHWFKWEAYSTWLSGFALMIALYYANARTYLVDPAVADLSPGVAVAISAALLVAGWLAYDGLCRAMGLGRERLLAASITALLVLAAWGASQIFSARAVYVQLGAMMGTIMAANVLFVIIPSQRRLVDAKKLGVAPDPVHGQRGKQRSVHNNYLTLPVLFTMISNHYPATWGHPRGWLVLVAIGLIAAYVRHFFNLRHKGRTVWAIPASAALAALAVAFAIAPSRQAGREVPSFAQVRSIVDARCVPCHAEKPAQPGFDVAPKGVVLETTAQVVANAARIRDQAVTTRAMPIGNLTAMTDAERAALGAWIAAGAPPH
jgi:uncharacterized membrane protein